MRGDFTIYNQVWAGFASDALPDNDDVEVNMYQWINALADHQNRGEPAFW
jgi:hypothetical protein